jgi:hypothetical protein
MFAHNLILDYVYSMKKPQHRQASENMFNKNGIYERKE